MIHPTHRGSMEMVAAMVLSGTIGFFVVESGQSVWNVVFFRCLFGAISLAVYCGLRGLLFPWRFDTRTFLLALLGGGAIVLNWVLLFSSYTLASISIATAVYNTQPFFLILLGMVLFGERPTNDAFGFIAVAFVGLLLVVKVDAAGLSLTSGMLGGFVLALGAALLYAVASIVTRHLKGLPPHLVALVQAILGTLILAPLADFSAVPTQTLEWGYLVTLGVVHTGIMYILLYSALQTLPTARVAVLTFIYPAVAIVIDYLVYGRDLSPAQLSGIALILLGSAGVNLKWRLGPSRAPASERVTPGPRAERAV